MDIIVSDLSIKSENIQSLYGYYIQNAFLVNRRYQRKLVWTIQEKQSFIESIINKYPVPLILLAEKNNKNNNKEFEIIDGMQRLNAIVSFINQEFDIAGEYFDLDTLADTKLAKDSHKISQKYKIMNRSICAEIARYQIPLSIYQEADERRIDEVFRRLNSGGKQLSRQELRQAGATSKFASIVRKLSSKIRGDATSSDLINLNLMQKISINNKRLDYGILAEDVFWIKNNIITKEGLRQSQDEEIIADIISWITLSKDRGMRSSSEILNELYGYSTYDPSDYYDSDGMDSDEKVQIDHIGNLADKVDIEIQKINEEVLINNIQTVFDEIISVIEDSGTNFHLLLFSDRTRQNISRYFQIVFYAFYQLIINKNKVIDNKSGLIESLRCSGGKIMKLPTGGGRWSAKDKLTQMNSLIGVIQGYFRQNSSHDPARSQWVTKFENLLTQSAIEGQLYDFKIGLSLLKKEENPVIQNGALSKIIKTLTAMANTNLKSTGYCIIGVADSRRDAERYSDIYDDECIKIRNSDFWVTGIQSEALKLFDSIDIYFEKILQLIDKEPISDPVKDYIKRNIVIIKYFNKDIMILKIESMEKPITYDKKYYVRHGNSVQELDREQELGLFERFFNPASNS